MSRSYTYIYTIIISCCWIEGAGWAHILLSGTEIISIESFYTFLRACYNLQDSHSQTGLGVTFITLELVISVGKMP
jgi:hypothetical protein